MSERLLYLASWVAKQIHLLPQDKSKTEVRNILVIKLDYFGDLIMATPVIDNLKIKYPDAHISLLVGPWMETFANDLHIVDEVITFCAGQFVRNKNTFKSQSYRELVEILRGKYDIVINMRGDWTILFWAILKKPCIFLDYGITLVNDFIHRRVPTHYVDRNLRVIEESSIPVHTKTYALSMQSDEIGHVLKRLGIKPYSDYAVIHPGASEKAKQWPADYFAELVTLINKNLTYACVVIGSKEEEKIYEKIFSKLQKTPPFALYNACGKLTISQVGVLLSYAKLFVGNDSGPLHYASALGISSVGIYRSLSLDRFSPRGNSCTICVHNRKIDLISVSEVMNAITNVVEEGK